MDLLSSSRFRTSESSGIIRRKRFGNRAPTLQTTRSVASEGGSCPSSRRSVSWPSDCRIDRACTPAGWLLYAAIRIVVYSFCVSEGGASGVKEQCLCAIQSRNPRPFPVGGSIQVSFLLPWRNLKRNPDHLNEAEVNVDEGQHLVYCLSHSRASIAYAGNHARRGYTQLSVGAMN